jgi:hypothetical protein
VFICVILEIAKSNSKISNNSARLVAITLIISVAKLAATNFIIPVIATPFKLATLAISIIATPFKHNACKAISGCIASSAS